MKYPNNPSYSDDDYEGCVTAGRATGRPIPLPSDEDLRRAEEAWNAPSFSERWKDEGFVGAGWVPKPTVDPNRGLLPSLQEIQQLPRRAQVAFAARCAHRILPLISSCYRFLFAKAIDIAEQAQSETQAQAEAVATDARAWAQRADESGFGAAAAAAFAAQCYAAARARENVPATDPYAADYAEVATSACARAVAATVRSLFSVVTVGTIGHLAAPARDFDRLLMLARTERWTDDTPVPPSVFGPMWESTPPEWWTDEPLTESPSASDQRPEPTDAAGAPR